MYFYITSENLDCPRHLINKAKKLKSKKLLLSMLKNSLTGKKLSWTYSKRILLIMIIMTLLLMRPGKINLKMNLLLEEKIWVMLWLLHHF